MQEVISLRKYFDRPTEPLVSALLESHQATLRRMGEAADRACPHTGQPLGPELERLRAAFEEGVTAESIAAARAAAARCLDSWSESAAGYSRRKAAEVRELLLLLTRTAENLGERDRRSAGRFGELTRRLHGIAGLEDLSEVRHAILRSASDLAVCIEGLERDARQSISSLNAEVLRYRERLEETERLAFLDPLTGIANRRRIEWALEMRMAEPGPFSIGVFDLNDFKGINDRHGHLAGDEALRQFGAELRGAVTASELAGRWGGDEFIVLLEGGEADAQRRMELLGQRIFGEHLLECCGQRVRVAIHAASGVAAYRPGEPVCALLARADERMYAGKRVARR